MRTSKFLFAFALFFAVTFNVAAQSTISVDDLTKQLKNSDYIIIAAGPDSEYNKSHITGAISLPYTAFDQTGEIEGLLVSDSEMAKILGDKGISEKKTIVVYDEFDSRYAARIFSLLKYLGATDVKILDGGMEAWKKGRKPITRNPSTLSKTTFNASPNKSLMVDMGMVVANSSKPATVLIDTRAPAEFNGTEQNSKGHLPNAINIEYKELLTADGMLKSKAELEKVYAAKGVAKDKEVILYCSSGVRTGLHYLALVNVLGYTSVKIYDGGYNEFVNKNPGAVVK